MAIQVPDSIESVINSFDCQIAPFSIHDVWSSLIEARKELAPSTPEDSYNSWGDILAVSLAKGIGANPWGTYFGPMSIAVKDDGAEIFLPDVREATPDIIELWQDRARKLVHPLLRARYADLVWDLSSVVTGQRSDHEFARIAIEAYLDGVDQSRFAHPTERFHDVVRAHSLAMQIADRSSVHAARLKIMQMHSETMVEETPLWWLAFDFFINLPYKEVTTELEQLVADLESVVAKHQVGSSTFDPFAVEGAGDRLAKFYHRRNRGSDGRRIREILGRTAEHHAGMCDAMVGPAFLQKAVDAYRSAGLAEDANRARIAMEEAIRQSHALMTHFEQEITITHEQMERFIASIVTDSPVQTFVKLASQFLVSQSVMEQRIQELAKSAPLMSHITMVSYADDHVTGKIGSVEDDQLGRLIKTVQQDLQMSGIWLDQALRRAIERHEWLPEHFATWTNRLGLYDSSSLLLHGFSAWYAGDFVTAICVLVPQVELGLRSIVAKLGKPTTKSSARGSVAGISVAIGMNDILYSDEIVEALGPDFILHFRSLYADQRGINLRNEVAHGLLKFEEMHQAIANLVVQSLLVFGIWDKIAEKRR